MDSILIEHLWKILTTIGGAIAFIITWCWRIRSDVNSLKQTRETFRECLPALKADVAKLKTDTAVDRAVLERMEAALERIEAKIDGKDK